MWRFAELVWGSGLFEEISTLSCRVTPPIFPTSRLPTELAEGRRGQTL